MRPVDRMPCRANPTHCFHDGTRQRHPHRNTSHSAPAFVRPDDTRMPQSRRPLRHASHRCWRHAMNEPQCRLECHVGYRDISHEPCMRACCSAPRSLRPGLRGRSYTDVQSAAFNALSPECPLHPLSPRRRSMPQLLPERRARMTLPGSFASTMAPRRRYRDHP